MKHFKYLALLLFCSFTDIETRDCIKDWNYDQLKVREQGRNAGLEVSAYLDNCNLPEGNPWCGCYVLTGCVICGVKDLPSCPASVPCWFRDKEDVIWQRGISGVGTPQRSDMAGFYFPELSRTAHIGFILIWDTRNGVALIQSGNTNEFGSRDGEGVYMKIYAISQIQVVADKITTKGSPNIKYHIIQKKENLFRIAIRYKTTVENLIRLNNLTGNDIRIGQKIRVA